MKKIPKEQVIKRIKSENVWWLDKNLPYDKLDSRPYLNLLFPLIYKSEVNRAIVLMGPRRVGKTVLLHHSIRELINSNIDPGKIVYFSVDHPLYNTLSLEDLLELYSEITKTDTLLERCFVFFDEIQYLRNWEQHLKLLVDRYPNLKFISSGSSAAALKLKNQESGAGRFTEFLLPPLTFYEYMVLTKKKVTDDVTELNRNFMNYLNFGGYPEAVFSEEIQSDLNRFIKSDIIDKVLLRDLPSLYGIQDIRELNYLFTTLAFNTANEVSLEELSKNSGVAKNTIKRYIEYLEAAFLIKIVHRVDRNAKKFLRANYFKVYLTNPSMRAALFSPVDLNDESIGSIIETAIFSQWFHSQFPLYYARWSKGEVDIVGLSNEQRVLWALEVKWSNRYYEKPEELKNLIEFCHKHNLKKAIVTTIDKWGKKDYHSVTLNFMYASIYAYLIGQFALEGAKQIEELADFTVG